MVRLGPGCWRWEGFACCWRAASNCFGDARAERRREGVIQAHDEQIVVLDELTASLDPRQEYLVYRRFKELARDKIAILISHRLSSVRMADRIYVIEHGHVTESGSHEELLASPGMVVRRRPAVDVPNGRGRVRCLHPNHGRANYESDHR